MKVTWKKEIKNTEKINNEEIIKLLLENRGITDSDNFLNPKNPREIHLSDFGYKKEIETTLAILEKIKKDKTRIVVYTDYDADGITGGAILWETLHKLGFDVMPYVPHRQHEGYGFSIKGIDNVKKLYNPALIVSVDHGITAKDKVTYAKKLGIPIIITDHHLKPEHIPADAKAIFHIPELSGSGVSYLFSKMLYEYFKENSTNYSVLTTNFSADYIALASIGSIADLVPLTGSTRSIVRYGLETCGKTKRIGLCNLMEEAGINGKVITPYEVGFVIAPRINAIGRLEHAIDALRLLCTTSSDKAKELASKIGGQNRLRQDLVKDSVAEAKIQVEAMKTVPNIITLVSDHWHEGIIGLIASKMTELYYRPTIVITKVDGFYKGSARSIPALHMTKFLRSLKDEYLIDAGGHRQAAGFTIDEKKVTDFVKKVEKESKNMFKETDLEKIVETDLKVPLSKITMRLAKDIEALQPFGIGNAEPTFFSQAEILDIKIMGKNRDHLKLIVKDPYEYSFPMELIAFGKADLAQTLSKGDKLTVVYTIQIDHWGGGEKLKGKINFIL